ncbi:MAG: hypothetical protein LBF67_08540 [Prevotellaceae bacterium]|nr:hypothetical protein [Prevotellaceae bacterium]
MRLTVAAIAGKAGSWDALPAKIPTCATSQVGIFAAVSSASLICTIKLH